MTGTTTSTTLGKPKVSPALALEKLKTSWILFKWTALSVAFVLLGATWLEVSHLGADLQNAMTRGDITPLTTAKLTTALWWLKGIVVGIMVIQLSALLIFSRFIFKPAIHGAIEVTCDADEKKAELKRLAMVVERTVNGVVITDTNAHVEWVNRGFTRISGYTLEELKGKTPGKVLQCENTDPETTNRMRQAVSRGQAFQELVINRAKNGKDYWVEIEAQPLYDDMGRLTGFMAIETDVSERQQLEQQVRRSEERLRLATDAADIGVWEYDRESDEMRWSDTFCRVHGLTPEQCNPSLDLWSSLLHPQESGNALKDMIETLDNGDDWRSVIKIVIHGHARYILTVAKDIERTAGKQNRITGVCIDVTNEHNLRAETEHQLAVLERLGEAARICAWEYHTTDKQLTWSPQVRKLHEVSDDYIPDISTAINFYTSEAREQISKAIQFAIDFGEPYDLELPFVSAQGTQLWVRTTGRPERDEYGRVSKIWGVFQDITELKQTALLQDQARRAAEAANEQKTHFLANMSHEIRTPLVSILGYTELLAADANIPEEERTRCIDVIRRNGEHLSALVNDILDFSKIDAAGVNLHPEECSPSQILQDVISMLRHRTVYKKLDLSISIDENVPTKAHLDPLKLRQILVNLTGNAVKFTEKGYVRVELSTFEPASATSDVSSNDPNNPDQSNRPLGLRITVEDTGPGIKPASLDTLFEPFTQGDPTYTRQHGGTGLGLVISRSLARAMGGDIFYDHNYSNGSRFIVTLIAERSEPAKQSTHHTNTNISEPPATTKHKRNSLRSNLLIEPCPQNVDESDQHDATSTQPPIPAPTPKPEPAGAHKPLRGKRILLAEDSPDSRRLFVAFLENAGADLTIVDNGEDAVNAVFQANADNRPFQLVLMDIQMPVIDGHEATRRIRRSDNQTPIIALTAHASPDDVTRSMQAGCNDHLTKPIKRDKLITSCEHWASITLQESARSAA